MIWALLLAYFLASSDIGAGVLTSSDVKALGKQVAILVTDEHRAEVLAAQLDEFEDAVTSFEKAFGKSARKLDTHYRDHDSDQDATYAILNELNRAWEQGQAQVLDHRFELRNVLTANEWYELFGDDED